MPSEGAICVISTPCSPFACCSQAGTPLHQTRSQTAPSGQSSIGLHRESAAHRSSTALGMARPGPLEVDSQQRVHDHALSPVIDSLQKGARLWAMTLPR